MKKIGEICYSHPANKISQKDNSKNITEGRKVIFSLFKNLNKYPKTIIKAN